ncbi:MAG: S-layer homology domain-containing protein [Selenomonadaceae bacterium]|nr:S-layer homology domain-containing protein [Selenomonadaceae bacterium]
MKKFLTTLATAAVLTASSSFVSAAAFTDIPLNHWANRAVTAMSDAGIVEGYSDGTFRGDKAVTCTEFAKMAGNLLVKVSPNSTAAAKKLVEDSSSDKNITRFEIALICSQVYTKVKDNMLIVSNIFRDVPDDHWAAKAVNLMGTLKVMEGYGDGTFRGDKNMTRYEAALVLNGLYKAVSN